MALSPAGMNGAATRSAAARSPVANEPATIQPMRILRVGREAGSPEAAVWSTLEVTMAIIPSAGAKRCVGSRPCPAVASGAMTNHHPPTYADLIAIGRLQEGSF